MIIQRHTTYVLYVLFLLTGSAAELRAQYMDLLLERVAHYPFSDAASDISGFDNHGTIHGALPADGFNGETGGAFRFDGLDDHIACGNGLPSLSTQITVACWIRADTSLKNSHIVTKYDFLSDAGFILGTEDGSAKWAGRTGNGQYIRMTSRSSINDGSWHFVAGMIDGPQWLLLVDGSIENQLNTGNANPSLSNNTTLYIGAFEAGEQGMQQHFRGTVDNVIIYNRILNDCELQFLFTGSPHGPR
jgi:hypothetical protein